MEKKITILKQTLLLSILFGRTEKNLQLLRTNTDNLIKELEEKNKELNKLKGDLEDIKRDLEHTLNP